MWWRKDVEQSMNVKKKKRPKKKKKTRKKKEAGGGGGGEVVNLYSWMDGWAKKKTYKSRTFLCC